MKTIISSKIPDCDSLKMVMVIKGQEGHITYREISERHEGTLKKCHKICDVSTGVSLRFWQRPVIVSYNKKVITL